MADFITCPKCGGKIPLTDVITHQIEEQLQVRLTQGLEEREREHAEALAAKELELRQEFDTPQAEDLPISPTTNSIAHGAQGTERWRKRDCYDLRWTNWIGLSSGSVTQATRSLPSSQS